MYVSSIFLDRFGACSNSRLEHLADGLQVIFGAQGSGKATTVGFLRSMWTGFAPSLRAKYIPADSRGFGGAITVQTPEGRHSISRYDDGSREGRFAIARTRMSESISADNRLYRAQSGLSASNPENNLSFSSAQDIKSAAQGINVDHADGAGIVRRNLQDFLGNVTPELLDHVFVVDFQSRPRIEDLLTIAETRGLLIADQPVDSDRLRIVDEALVELRGQLERVAVPIESLATLQARKREALREIDLLEGNVRRHADETARLRNRLTASIADLERQEGALRAECADLEATINDRQSRLPCTDNPPPVPSSNDLAAQLRGLDAQLVRWKRTLREVVARQQRAAERSDNRQLGGAAIQAALADPRQRLRDLESRIVELQQAAGQLPNRGQSCVCQPLQTVLAETLVKMRDDLYRLCNDLSCWQTHHSHQQAVAERDQLARCELELRQSIRTLVERRQALSFARTRLSVANPNASDVTVPDEHTAFCHCAEHPRVELVGNRDVGRAEDVTRLQAEIASLNDRREQTWRNIEDIANELTRQREQLRGLNTLPPDLNLARTGLSVSIPADHSISSAHSLSGEIAGRRAAVTRLDQSIREHERRQECLQEISKMESEAQRLRAEARPAGLLAEASDNLRRLTSGDQVQLHLPRSTDLIETTTAANNLRLQDRARHQSSRELTVEDCHGERKLVHALDQGGRDQVVLALVLAVVSACDRQGVRVPLVLNAPFTHYPSKDVRGALELLCELGRGRQVLCFTRHQHVESLCRALSIPVHVLEATPPAVIRPPASVVVPASAPSAITRPALQLRDFELPALEETTPEYYLYEHDPVERAPSLEPHHVERLRRIGLDHVGDLLGAQGADVVDALRSVGVSLDQFQTWQAQARLMTRVRGLRPYDARVLVACGVADADHLRTINPSVLRARVKEFSQSPEGKSLLLSGTEFELSRITDWFNDAREHALRERREDLVRRRSAREHRANPEGASRRREQRAESNGSNVVPLKQDHSRPRFLLHRHSPVVDAPTIGPSMAKRLEKVQVFTVDDLLRVDPQSVAIGLGISRITHKSVRQWQQQAELVCRVPQLPGYSSQLLVALGVTSVETLAALTPSELLAKVQSFASSLEGKRFLRNASPPDLDTIAAWISGARQARALNAA